MTKHSSNLSKKSRGPDKSDKTLGSLIGVFILAAGLGLMAAVSYLAYKKLAPPPAITANQDNPERPAPVTAAQDIKTQPQKTQAPPSRPDLKLRKAELAEITGEWAALYGQNLITLGIKDGRYTLNLIQDPKGYQQRFAQGPLSYDDTEGILTLMPDFSAPLPQIKGAEVITLTSRKHDIVILIDESKGDMIWRPHIKDNGARYQLHPLFPLIKRGDSFIAFKRQKRN